MNEIKVIEQQEVLGKDFKIYGTVDKPLFLAKDVAVWIEHNKPSELIRNIDDDEKVVDIIATLGGNQKAWFITEDGLYEVLMQSRKPIAKEFKKKVKDILKDIRKTGMYATDELLDNPDLLISVATALKEEREKTKKLSEENNIQKQVIGELKPKADYTDKILSNKGLVTITQIAKDYGMTGNSMNNKLHNLGIQYKQSGQWLLYSKYQGLGYTHSDTVNITRSNGNQDIKMNTKWTQKGRLFLYELLKGVGVFPSIEQIA